MSKRYQYDDEEKKPIYGQQPGEREWQEGDRGGTYNASSLQALKDTITDIWNGAVQQAAENYGKKTSESSRPVAKLDTSDFSKSVKRQAAKKKAQEVQQKVDKVKEGNPFAKTAKTTGDPLADALNVGTKQANKESGRKAVEESPAAKLGQRNVGIMNPDLDVRSALRDGFAQAAGGSKGVDRLKTSTEKALGKNVGTNRYGQTMDTKTPSYLKDAVSTKAAAKGATSKAGTRQGDSTPLFDLSRQNNNGVSAKPRVKTTATLEKTGRADYSDEIAAAAKAGEAMRARYSAEAGKKYGAEAAARAAAQAAQYNKAFGRGGRRK